MADGPDVETDELKDDDEPSRSPSHHNDPPSLEDHADSQFPPGFPPFYGYPPDGANGEGGSPPNGIAQFFPFPPNAAPPGLYQAFGANMPGGPLFPIPIGQLTGVGAFKQKRIQVKNACVNCAQACKKCDNGRPCERCKKYGIADTCVDSARKERKKGVKRGPYKRRLKSGPTEQDGQESGDWHPHEPPSTVDPSILPQSPTSGSGPSFGGPEGYYSYPYPYPLPPPGEGGSQNGEAGSFSSLFPSGYPPYPHWQPPFGQGEMIGGTDDSQTQEEGANASGASANGGSARTSGKKKRAAAGEEKSSSGKHSKKNALSKRSALPGKLARSSKKSKVARPIIPIEPVDPDEKDELADMDLVTDPNLLEDELAGIDDDP